MHSDEESLPRTPLNEEEGFRLSLSTPEVNSLLLNSFQPLSSTRSPTVSSSKRNPRRMYNFLKGKCRRRVCSTRGCDGSGHRNIKRWSEGHTTRAGCPRVPR